MAYQNEELAQKVKQLYQEWCGRTDIGKHPVFDECIELMQNTPEIQARLDKLVGTVYQARLIEAESLLSEFIVRVRPQEVDFEVKYKEFENLFYAQEITVVRQVRLHNFSSKFSTIDLSDNVKIIRMPLITPDEYDIRNETKRNVEAMQNTIRGSNYVIQVKINQPVHTYSDEIDTNSRKEKVKEVKEFDNKASELFDQVVNCLHLITRSDVYRDKQVEMWNEEFYWESRSTFGEYESRFWRKQAYLEDDKPLKEIFRNVLELQNDERFKVAVTRFISGILNPRVEDKVVDFIIALEALYLPEVRSELKFRAQLGVALLLCKEYEERKEIYQLVGKAYNHRSIIVHGGNINKTKQKNKLENTETQKLEDILRRSLGMYIDNQDLFSPDSFNDLYLGKR